MLPDSNIYSYMNIIINRNLNGPKLLPLGTLTATRL